MADASDKPNWPDEEALRPDEPQVEVETGDGEDVEPRSVETALVPRDALGRYLAEIRRYPLLTPEEEHRLAVEYKEGSDLKAAYRLVTANLRLVVMIARRYENAFRDLFEFPRPVVAAANGHAIAGGCLLVAACDYRLMSAGKIGVPELLVGVPFPAIAVEILRYAAGRDAQWLAYSGALLTPEDARGKGLVDEVVAPDSLMARAAEVAQMLAAAPPDSFRITKMQFRRGGDFDSEAMSIWSRPDIHAHIREYLSRTVGRK